MKKALITSLILILFLPTTIEAKSLKVSGWIPYWEEEAGINEAKDNLSDLDIIHPFIYEVTSDGSIKARADIKNSDWQSLIKKADRRRIDIIPAISWFNGYEIHNILSDKSKVEEHIENIVDLVEDNDFDGIDIDYEQKLADTIDYYSKFLEDLKDELNDKKLHCTVEARTPKDSLYRTLPKTISYANDYEEINKHCDVIEIMTYDQQRADWKLNQAAIGNPYVPVADPAWQEKVIKLALKDIDNDKIMLGIPTYGRIWELTVTSNQYKEYKSLSSITELNALKKAKDLGIEPILSHSGEYYYSYFNESSPYKALNPILKKYKLSAHSFALILANITNQTIPVNLVWFNQADSQKEKIKIAEKHDLKGVAIFKIDGQSSNDLWDNF